jgi:hypothetical protein
MADNTFATARNLGFLERGGARRINIKDSISRSDRVDFVRFTIQPGAAALVKSSFRVQGGSMAFSFFAADPLSGQIIKRGGLNKILGKRNNSIAVPEIPLGAPPLDCYIKFDKPTQNIKYQLRLTLI